MLPMLLALMTLLDPATRPAADVPTYLCRRATTPITLDGRGDDPAWQRAEWTSDFVDIEGDPKPRPRHRTRARMLWDDRHLYVHAELLEPHVWGTLTDRNAIIYHDNDFEVFIDPDGDTLRYYEFEVNALNTIMELTLDKPYHAGGNYTFVKSQHVRSAVHVDGTLNDPRDTDRAWSVEIAFAFADLDRLAAGVNGRPKPGDTWRINFSRVQWTHEVVEGAYRKIPKERNPEDNWVWSPTGVIDMHRPETWGVLRFAE